MKILKKSCLVVIFLGLSCICCSGVLQASEVKMTAGQAVLVEGSEKARRQAVGGALGEALSLYIYEDMAVSHNFEPQINEEILKNREAYVKSYAIQSERTLGDLYQVELRVELQADLIAQALKKIEKGERQQVEYLTLVVLPPDGSGDEYAPVENGGLRSLALEPSALLQSLGQELAIYGFSLGMADPVAPELSSMLEELFAADENEGRQSSQASWFKGLLPGDLIIVVKPSGVSEERIVSLQKSFWRSRAKLLFIDTRNDMITFMPEVFAKVIDSDYITGLEKLTENLTAKVQKVSLDRLLRDYIVPQENDLMMVLKCQGFRSPADFAAFKESLQSLRTVKEISLQALTAGTIELGVRVLTSAPLLIKWLNDFHIEAQPFTLKTYPLDENPDHYLVRVNYNN